MDSVVLQALLMDKISIGDVFRLPLTPEDGIIPKNSGDAYRNKMFVVLGKDNEENLIGAVVINSTINQNLSNEIKMLQYPITSMKYDFLTHNSHIDCADLKEIQMHRFANTRGRNGYIGKLELDDLEYVIGAVKESPIVTPKTLRRFGIDKL